MINNKSVYNRMSYWHIFRIVFVIFSLYLLCDAFYRWDGFRYHSTFSEFLPAVALVTILWTIVAVLTTLILWVLIRCVEWFCMRIKLKIKIETLLIFIAVFVLLGIMTWIYRRHIWDILYLYKYLLLSIVTLIAIIVAWLSRYKADRWFAFIQERLTPLVWLFITWVILSVPIVAYYTWIRNEDKVRLQIVSQIKFEGKNRPNIVLVTFDTLTARDMSIYGYYRPTTPFIEKWAKEAFLFTNAKSPGNCTTPCTATLMTGKEISTHKTYYSEAAKPFKADKESLPLLLKNNGYYNMAFIANPKASVKTLGVSNAFDYAPKPTKFSVPISLYGWLKKLLNQSFGDKIELHDWIIKEDFAFFRFVAIISRNISKTIQPPENVFNSFLDFIEEVPMQSGKRITS